MIGFKILPFFEIRITKSIKIKSQPLKRTVHEKADRTESVILIHLDWPIE